MKRRLISVALVGALSIGISTISSIGANAENETPVVIASPTGPDESRPIASYCEPSSFACEGYVALSPEQFLPPWAPAFRNVQGYYHNDLSGLYRYPSWAIRIDRDASGQATSVESCSDIASSSCVGQEIYFNAILPICSETSVIDCVRSISITNNENKPLEFSIVGEFPAGNPQSFKGSPQLKVPNGAAPTLIRIPGAPHNGGDLYLVKAQVTGSKQAVIGQSEFSMENMSISITAVKLIDGDFGFGGVSTDASLYQKGFSNIGGDDWYPSNCAIASATQCATRYSLPLGLRYGVTVDLSQKITGWLHGRIKSPQVEVKSNSYGGSTIGVSAEAIKIPVNAGWVNNDTAPQAIKDFYAGKPNYGSPLFGNSNKSKPLSEIALLRDANTGHNQETLDEYLAWLPSLGDKAQALPTAWVVQTMSNYQVADEIRQCLNKTDALAGIVTTNAAEYLDGPPVYDKASGSLDYKVAATHYEPDGVTVFKGSYDLVMSSTVARCIYGFTNAPISATVSISSDSNSNNVATTVVSEKSGWLSLGAYNFTYSSPTIRVVLTGTSAKQAVVIAPKKKVATQITCVKGKSVKKVKAVACPSGYKKKS